MKKIRNKKYYFSTEGETEKWYLEHLEKLINKDFKRVEFIIKKARPKCFVKQITILFPVKIYHFFDVESNSPNDVEIFKNLLDEMEKSENLGKEIEYVPCYSNLTFELWIILHKMNCFGSKTSKKDYLSDINKAFNVKYQSLDEYKKEKHFKQILNTITLDDVKSAVQRAGGIMKQNAVNHKEQTCLKYKWFADNPATEAGRVIGKILKDCGL